MSAESTEERRNTERIFARGFTILGGIFWTVTAFAGPYVFGGRSVLGAFEFAAIPLVFTLGVLVVGWFFERLVAIILAVAAVGTVVWGVIMGWPTGVWAIMASFFITPTIIAAILFFLAGTKTASSRPAQG